MKNQWIEVKPFGPDAYTYWINGIYKIVKYPNRDGMTPLWHAYYIPDGYKNWGENVGKPERYPCGNGMSVSGWRSWSDAEAACMQHATRHTPTTKIIKRAEAIKAALIQQAKAWEEKNCA